MKKYGEILFLGPCNLKCFYCLSNEMDKLRQDGNNQLNTYFSEWENFEKFITILKENNIDTVYLSSVVTDPLLYQYLEELIFFLKDNSFKVGIRTNGYLSEECIDALLSLDEEISFSINSLNRDSNYRICQATYVPDSKKIFTEFRNRKKQCRLSIVVNEYNYTEIFEMLDFLNDFSDVISYIQLRKVYKYGNNNSQDIYFEKVKEKLMEIADEKAAFYESLQYLYKNLTVSLWGDVFKKESISSVNFFTNGIISTNNLLIPAYEKGEVQ